MKLFLVEWNYNDGDYNPTSVFVGVFDSLDKIPKEIKEYKNAVYKWGEFDPDTHRAIVDYYTDDKVYFGPEENVLQGSYGEFKEHCYSVTEIEINKVINNYN